MFFRRKQPPQDITASAYTRWLRAGRPPFDDFLRMTEEDQEGLASIGDEHTQDVCIALATALTSPHALLAGAEVEEHQPDASALGIAQKMAASVTMGGSGGAKHVRPVSQRPMGTMFGAKGEQVG